MHNAPLAQNRRSYNLRLGLSSELFLAFWFVFFSSELRSSLRIVGAAGIPPGIYPTAKHRHPGSPAGARRNGPQEKNLTQNANKTPATTQPNARCTWYARGMRTGDAREVAGTPCTTPYIHPQPQDWCCVVRALCHAWCRHQPRTHGDKRHAADSVNYVGIARRAGGARGSTTRCPTATRSRRGAVLYRSM